MSDDGLKDLLLEAAGEINVLRRQNEILNAKVEVMELFACVLFTKPAQQSSGGMAPDVVWSLRNVIDAMEKGKTHEHEQE